MINLTINNLPVAVPEGATILDAAVKAGIDIPTLCYLKEINAIGACRICVVEVKGARGLVTACVYPVTEGMVVQTNTKRVLDARRRTLNLILSNHNQDCTSCGRSHNCELQALANAYGADRNQFAGAMQEGRVDDSTGYLVRDNSKCILCRRCEAVCRKVQDTGVIGANQRGFKTHIGCAFELPLNQSPCGACGQCINVCPTGALSERSEIEDVVAALSDPKKHVVVGTAPAVRAAIGEEFGLPLGTNAEGKMATALHMLGFDRVLDVNMTADLTIMEEGTEFLHRLKEGGTLPMITSCSPGWIRYVEAYYPELLPNVSSCKSPQQMFGAIVKSYYAQKNGIDPHDIYVVSVMPCIAKKAEKLRADQGRDGMPDIDAVLTTRELAKLIRRYGISFNALPDGTFDHPFGASTGAGVIFGTGGGVMEAALRTVAELVNGRPLENVEFKKVRAGHEIKEATVPLDGIDVKVCVVNGLSNVKKVMENVKAGKAQYHFIEVMCCPGGCINGGGQPLVPSKVRNATDYLSLRRNALYTQDKKSALRKSHENPIVKEI
ncbi:MAG: [FeFe] hydrogenase, group A, partial [Clostridiales bacterium]|nr:[FeFe] hydrogenase, group A [Clostridiales bacterium]